jgi:hypothetical protein
MKASDVSRWAVNSVCALVLGAHAHVALAANAFVNPLLRQMDQSAAEVKNVQAEIASKTLFGTVLNAGQELQPSDALMSKSGEFRAYVNKVGYLVVANKNGGVVWASPSAAPNGKLAMQGDGNLCLYPQQGGQAWCSRSNRPGNGFFALLRDTGVLEIYQGDAKAVSPDKLIWTSLLDAQYYSNRYGDLRQAYNGNDINLMYHWVTYGRYEGRSPRGGFDDALFKQLQDAHLSPKFYADKYPDLKAAFGYDPLRLYQHWTQYGFKEGRVPNQAAFDFLKDAPRSANGRSEMRIGDWLKNNERMVSRNQQFIAVMQGDANIVVYRGQTPSPNGRVWWQRTTSSPERPYFMTVQKDGHFCTYEDIEPNVSANKNLDRHGNGIACSPGAAGGPLGSYYISLEDDGNLVIHRGSGPADNRGQLWDSNSAKPKPASTMWEQIGGGVMKGVDAVTTAANATYQAGSDAVNWVNGAANTVNNATVSAANTVAGVSVDAYTTVRDEAVSFVNDPLAWVRKNCAVVANYVPVLGGYDNDAMKLAKLANTIYPNQPTQEAMACTTAFKQGVVCQVPEEFVNLIKDIQAVPNLVKNAYEESRGPECTSVADHISKLNAMFKPLTDLGVPMPNWFTAYAAQAQTNCGIALMVGKVTVSAGKCTVAAAKAGVLQRMFNEQAGGGSDMEKACRLGGKYALKAAKSAVLKKVPASPAKVLYEMVGRAGSLNEFESLPDCREGSYAQVNAAWYGVENGPRVDAINNVKVADKVRDAMKFGQVSVPADMNGFFGGDPAPGKAKVLALQVTDGGTTLNLRQVEGRALKYPGTEGVDYQVMK